MSPVFFVNKKDRSKRIVMDYCNLNNQIVKNNYLLLLIIDLIGNKKVFTKLDLRQGFNNVRIKERDKQKRVFIIHIESFELTVIFFRMTNLLVTFQIIINEILRDLINKEKVTAFVDDILVKIETKERYNKIVNKILKRLEENNLYVKPEKYVQKVRKIEFLGVVIGPNRIEIKKKKIDKVLS